MKSAGQDGSKRITARAHSPTGRPRGAVPGPADGETPADNLHRLLFDQMSTAVVLGETLYDSAGTPIDYRIVDANPAFERLIGRSVDQVIGQQASSATLG